MMVEATRLDKWLWAVRLYKTRSQAAEACAAGKVTVNGTPAKASSAVKPGDIVTAPTGSITRTLKVLSLISRRVGAKLVPEHAEDLTPASEYNKPREPFLQPIAPRPPGSGRPTKRDRRRLEDYFNQPPR